MARISTSVTVKVFLALRFILSDFFFFAAIVNDIISFSTSSLLMYNKSGIIFACLILCPATLLNLLLSSNASWWSLSVSLYPESRYGEWLDFFLSYAQACISFSCLIALPITSSTILNTSKWDWTSLVGSLHSLWCWLQVCHVTTFMLRDVPCMCVGGVNEWVLNFTECFFCTYRDGDYCDSSFHRCDMLYSLILHGLKQPCIPGINPTWFARI